MSWRRWMESRWRTRSQRKSLLFWFVSPLLFGQTFPFFCSVLQILEQGWRCSIVALLIFFLIAVKFHKKTKTSKRPVSRPQPKVQTTSTTYRANKNTAVTVWAGLSAPNRFVTNEDMKHQGWSSSASRFLFLIHVTRCGFSCTGSFSGWSEIHNHSCLLQGRNVFK